MTKRVRTNGHPRHKMKLDTVRGVATEQGRLYRLAVNQTIKTSEAARLCYILREIRCSLEAIPMPAAEDTSPSINVVEVPSNHFFKYVEALPASDPMRTIEHKPLPVADLQSENIFDRTRTISEAPIEFEPMMEAARQLIELRRSHQGIDGASWGR